MQWLFIITAEQWSAAGTFWGGMAQVALVLIGWYAGNQWFRQKRVKGLHTLVTECMQVIHDLDVTIDIGHATVSYHGVKEKQFEIIGEKYIQLMGIATRCRYYDDTVAEAITERSLHIRELLRAYDEKNDSEKALKEGVDSHEEK